MNKILSCLLCLLLLVSCLAPITSAQTSTELVCEAGNALDVIPDQKSCETIVELLNNLYNNPGGTSAGKWYSQTPTQFSRKVLDDKNPDEIFGERYTFAQINWIINSLATIVNPISGAQTPEDVLKILDAIKKVTAFNPKQQPVFADHATLGPLGIIASSFNVVYANPPASGIAQTKDAISRIAGLGTTSVHAQGVGYLKLGQGTIAQLWTAMRNIAFLVSALLLIAGAFMVMFRVQISPQTVVSIQLMLPKLIVSLVLIAFSYPIVGFVIDMVYVVIAAILGLLSFANPTLFEGNGITTAINSLLTGNFNFIGHFLALPIFLAIICMILVVIAQGFMFSSVPIVSGIAAVALIIAGILFGLFTWALYISARIIGQLFIAYLQLVLLTIFGPFQIMMDIIPTKKNFGFVPWFKCVVGNASVFVSYAVLALIAEVLFNFDWNNPFGLAATNLGLQSGFTLPLANFANLGSDIWISIFLGLGYFTAVPNIVQSIKDQLCKEEDQSRFIEKLTQDTVGQVNKAGQDTGKKIGEEVEASRIARQKAGESLVDTGIAAPPPGRTSN